MLTADILQLNLIQIPPDTLVGTRIRHITRQLLQMDAFGTTSGQEVLDHLPAMDWGAIPDHQQFAGDVLRQMLEKANLTVVVIIWYSCPS